VLVPLVIKLVSVGSREQFRLQWLSEQRRRCWGTVSGKLFQTKAAAAEKPLPPLVARQVREIARTVDDEVAGSGIKSGSCSKCSSSCHSICLRYSYNS